MKKYLLLFLLIAFVVTLTACGESAGDLSISPDITEYNPELSSTPGIALTAVFTRDLKNSDFKYHWIAEQGTFVMWHNEGNGRLENLGNDIMTNVHKIYWTLRDETIEDSTYEIYLSVENIYSSEVISETKILIQSEGGSFTIVQ